MISLSQVHPWKEILQEPEKEEEKEKQKGEEEKDKDKDDKEDYEEEDDKENEEEDDDKEDDKEDEEEEKQLNAGDNDLHDIPDNLLTKLLAIEMETLDTEKERINQETQPGTEGEIFIMR